MFRIGIEEIEEITKVIESKQLFKVNGGELQESQNLETELRAKFGVPYTLAMTSGHAALTSALIGMGIGPGDQVIVPAYTYIATAIAVVATGAIPVIAEVDESLTIDPIDVEKKITKATKAIIPVHIQGFPCAMDKICEIAKKYNLFVLEDACQADGGSFKGQRLATIGDAGAFSFNYYKIISSGEGGALLTKNRDIFEKALIYHDSSAVAFFGTQLDGVTTEPFCGQEFRTNEITAAILRCQLKKLDTILADLRANKKYLMDALANDCGFIKSNDIEGDCGTTIGILFDTTEQADRFAEAMNAPGCIPGKTKKHIYADWASIMNKRGACHPLMDPFKMEANKDIIPNYTKDMCKKSLDILCRVCYVGINPDWTKDEMDAKIAEIKAALKA